MTQTRHGARARRSGERRSVTEWAVRGGLALVALLLGYASVTRNLADILKRGDTARAHALAPGNGRITAILAERRFTNDPTGAQTSVARLASLALQQDATAVPAAATLGFQAQLRGETVRARRWFGYAQMLSRRHLPTQLWAVEDAVARGDVAGALRHYDTALRASKTAPDLLFPVLSTAIADPLIRSNLIATMARAPSWSPAYITYVATSRDDPRAAAALLAGLRRARVDVPLDATARVIDRLIEAGAVAEAWRYYAAVHPGADPRRSRDPRFAADPVAPAQFDWTVVDDGLVSASIQREGDGGIFDFSVPVGAAGPLLRQMQMLPAGAYRLDGRSAGIEQGNSLPYWVVTCGDGRELGRVEVPHSAQANGVFTGLINVPVSCPVQILSLMARSSDAMSGISGQIRYVRLHPVRPSASEETDR